MRVLHDLCMLSQKCSCKVKRCKVVPFVLQCLKTMVYQLPLGQSGLCHPSISGPVSQQSSYVLWLEIVQYFTYRL